MSYGADLPRLIHRAAVAIRQCEARKKKMSPYTKSQLTIIRMILAIAVWISLIPFVYAPPLAVAFYGAVLALAMGSFTLLRHVIARRHRDVADITGHHRHIQMTNLVAAALFAASAPLAFEIGRAHV